MPISLPIRNALLRRYQSVEEALATPVRPDLSAYTADQVLSNLAAHRASGAPLTQDTLAYLAEHRRVVGGQREAPAAPSVRPSVLPGRPTEFLPGRPTGSNTFETVISNAELFPGDLLTVDDRRCVAAATDEEATGVFIRYMDPARTRCEFLLIAGLGGDPTLRVLEIAASVLGGRAGQDALRQRDQMALREGQRRARMYSARADRRSFGSDPDALGTATPSPGSARPVVVPKPPRGGPVRKIIRKPKP